MLNALFASFSYQQNALPIHLVVAVGVAAATARTLAAMTFSFALTTMASSAVSFITDVCSCCSFDNYNR